MRRKSIPIETMIELRQRLERLPPRSSARRALIVETAELYGVSPETVYRSLRQHVLPQSLRRTDCGQPRVMPKQTLLRYCEVVAALKVRTTNGQGRHLSTVQAIRLLEEHGINTDTGHISAPPGLLKKTTVNRYLAEWGYDREKLSRQPPAVRFEAESSNQCWHFDLSSSDLKRLKNAVELEPGRGKPLLMLYSVVDDRSGVSYQEYHEVYGEDTGAALKFLFNAMSAKQTADFPFQGIPSMIYMDNGPIGRSSVFQKVMNYLGVEVRTHVPKGKDGRRVTARAKGKVERPFRTVKEMHETLYHLHEPETITEANTWLMQFLLHYNKQSHRRESHSRIEDWMRNLTKDGIREMCSWERFCTFAREPEKRKVGLDARVTVDGVAYEVEPDLAGEKVILWWGLFDTELYVEYQENRYGPFAPVGKPIPLHSYRSFKKTSTQKRADRIEQIASQLALPSSAIGKVELPVVAENVIPFPVRSFVDPDPFEELAFKNAIEAKRAIAYYLVKPLAKLTPEQMATVESILEKTLKKEEVMTQIKDYFSQFN
jgi:hypothetical protein